MKLAEGAQRVAHLVLTISLTVLSYVLYVTAFLENGISDNICATVCMQDKFEPTSVGKKYTVLLLKMSDRVFVA